MGFPEERRRSCSDRRRVHTTLTTKVHGERQPHFGASLVNGMVEWVAVGPLGAMAYQNLDNSRMRAETSDFLGRQFWVLRRAEMRRVAQSFRRERTCP